MQVASILSDLTSLRACDHSAALALVSVQNSLAQGQSTIAASSQVTSSVRFSDSSPPRQNANTKNEGSNEDLDMQRAMDLVELHYRVKLKYARREDRTLLQARRDVDGVLERLKSS